MNDKYVKLKDVKELLKLIKNRDSFNDWSIQYENYDAKVKVAVEQLEQNAVEI